MIRLRHGGGVPPFRGTSGLIGGVIFLGSLWSGLAFDPSSQDDSRAIVRHFKALPDGKEPETWDEGAGFAPEEGETICLIGGATVYEMQSHGYFEAHLQRSFPDRGIKVRNLGWAADTIFRQQRPMFFYTPVGDTREGSVPDQRHRIEPGTLILRFGKMESLGGEGDVRAFRKAYEGMIDALAPFTQRLVLVAPEPFFPVGPAKALAEQRNLALSEYASVIRELAEERNCLFVDLFHPLRSWEGEALSRTGIDLTEAGQREVGKLLAQELEMVVADDASEAETREAVRRLIVKKNQLWHQYYRPTNWAFLFGDRQHVPSSRDHRDANRRWFVEELEKLPGLISVTESEMSGVANQNR